MKLQEYTLKNGLRVVTVDTKSYPTFTCALLVMTGSREESAKNNGVAHFFEHMVFKGSKKFPAAKILSTLLDGMGGDHNAFTSQDHTGYWIRAANEHFDQAIELLADMTMHPLLDPAELEREKGAIVEEIHMYEDTPVWKASEFFDEHMYEGSSLGLPIAGTDDAVKGMTTDDLKSFLEYWYKPNNAVLVIAGGIGPLGSREVKSTIKEHFAKWKQADIPGHSVASGSIHRKRTITAIYKQTDQTHIRLGYPGLSYTDPDRFALGVALTVLGGGMSSRLFEELREKRGLCYYVSSSRQSFADVGHVVTSIGVGTEPKNIQEALRVAIAEHMKMQEHPISLEELERAKSMMKGGLLLGLEHSDAVADYYAKQSLFHGSLHTPEEICMHIDAVTQEDVQKVAKNLFRPEYMHVVTLGPVSDTQLHDFLTE